MAKLKAIVVVETEQGEVLSSHAFTPDEEGKNEAEAKFKALVKKHKGSAYDATSGLEDGYYNRDHIYVTYSVTK